MTNSLKTPYFDISGFMAAKDVPGTFVAARDILFVPVALCPTTSLPPEGCWCDDCIAVRYPRPERTTLPCPAAAPAAPAVPELCTEFYYGVPCTDARCLKKEHRLPRRKT